jgi:hypothetical protein
VFDYPTIAEICQYLDGEGYGATQETTSVVQPLGRGFPAAAAVGLQMEPQLQLANTPISSVSALQVLVMEAVRVVLTGSTSGPLSATTPLMSAGELLAQQQSEAQCLLVGTPYKFSTFLAHPNSKCQSLNVEPFPTQV